jgi:hypothetical protein
MNHKLSRIYDFDSFSSIEVRDNYLRFNRIAPADEGRYVCTASNLYGNTTKVAEVIVNTQGMFNTRWLPKSTMESNTFADTSARRYRIVDVEFFSM